MVKGSNGEESHYYRVTCIQDDVWGTEILEEAHRSSYEDAFNFIMEHRNITKNVLWVLHPLPIG